MDALQPVFPPNPKAGADHPLLQRLDAEIQAVNLGQLLGRQGRTKISVLFANQRQCQITIRLGQAVIARPATALRDQAGRAAMFQTGQQTKDLAPF